MPCSLSPILSPQELGLEVFTYALVYENDHGEAQKVLATASGKPFVWKESELQDLVYKTWPYWTSPVDLNTAVWESKFIVVDVGLRTYGLAIMLMDLVEAEV